MKNFSTRNIRSAVPDNSYISNLVRNSISLILSRSLLGCVNLVLRGNMIIVEDCVAELMRRKAAFEDFNRDTSIVVECRTATIECRLLTNLQVISKLNGSAYITLSFLFRSSQFWLYLDIHICIPYIHSFIHLYVTPSVQCQCSL